MLKIKAPELGWGFLPQFRCDLNKPHLQLGRVISEGRGWYRVVLPADSVEHAAKFSGSLRHQARGRDDFATVGDWVLLEVPKSSSDPARIVQILERKTAIRRMAAGTRREVQVLAANVDEVLIVMSCNADFNENRLDRARVLINESGAGGRLILSKSDLVDAATVAELIARIKMRFPEVAVQSVSVKDLDGIKALRDSLRPQATYIVLGSSGVGKSTLVNLLIGADRLVTAGIRAADDKGRHTTVARSLHRLANGVLVIDTPGIREIKITDDVAAVKQSFVQITALASACRFSNCQHGREPGCAVQKALANGVLSGESWANFKKLQAEAMSPHRPVKLKSRKRFSRN